MVCSKCNSEVDFLKMADSSGNLSGYGVRCKKYKKQKGVFTGCDFRWINRNVSDLEKSYDALTDEVIADFVEIDMGRGK